MSVVRVSISNKNKSDDVKKILQNSSKVSSNTSEQLNKSIYEHFELGIK